MTSGPSSGTPAGKRGVRLGQWQQHAYGQLERHGRHPAQQCRVVALHGRVEPALAETSELRFHRALADPALQDVVRRVADEIGYATV